jgi:hypothetical protein
LYGDEPSLYGDEPSLSVQAVPPVIISSSRSSLEG